jgi:transcriptional regulator with XRE-family HTH domain
MIDLKTIGARIKWIRKDLGLLQDEFARKMNVSPPTLSDVENGKTKPGFDIIYSLSDSVNVNLEFVLHGNGEIYKQNEKEIDNLRKTKPYGEFTGDVDEMLWFMSRSRLFLGFLTTQAKEYLYKNETLIERDIGLTISRTSIREQMEKKTNPILNSPEGDKKEK